MLQKSSARSISGHLLPVCGRPRIFKTNCAGSQDIPNECDFCSGSSPKLTTRVLFVSSESPSNAPGTFEFASRLGLFRFVSSALSRVQHHTDTSTLLRGTQRPQRCSVPRSSNTFRAVPRSHFVYETTSRTKQLRGDSRRLQGARTTSSGPAEPAV